MDDDDAHDEENEANLDAVNEFSRRMGCNRKVAASWICRFDDFDMCMSAYLKQYVGKGEHTPPFPGDIWLIILQLVDDPRTLLNVHLTCRYLYHLSSEHKLMKRFKTRFFSYPFPMHGNRPVTPRLEKFAELLWDYSYEDRSSGDATNLRVCCVEWNCCFLGMGGCVSWGWYCCCPCYFFLCMRLRKKGPCSCCYR